MIDAIVPAHNEEPTIGGVVDTLVDSGVFRRIVVVDDGSTDQTATCAELAGAEVLKLTPNRGKAEAMLAAVATSDARDLAFFDADLLGFKPEHVALLAEHHLLGFDQTCGLRDYGWLNPLQAFAPVMTGERFVKRWVLDALPLTCWRGYAIETAINFTVDARNGLTCAVLMPGVSIRNKTDKVGFADGWIRHARMAMQMRKASKALGKTAGSCDVGS